MLENGFYRVSTEENCFAETGLEMVIVFCENKEVNFECRETLGESKRQESAIRRSSLMKASAIDNKGSQADNGDMETQGTGKDNPSAISLQSSSRTEASVPVYYYYHWDHLGTTRLITTTPTAANPTGVVSRHDYEPFGVEIPPYPTGDSDQVKNTHRFTGHERDSSTGYDFMHFRYYASSMGRFLKPDNLIGNMANPQSWNLYSYVNGNPVNFNDPSGHAGERMAQPAYVVNPGSASWMNWGAYTSFYGGLYGGNVSWASGGPVGRGGGGGYQTMQVQTGWTFEYYSSQTEAELVAVPIFADITLPVAGAGTGALSELGRVIGFGFKNYGNLNVSNYGLQTIGSYFGISKYKGGCGVYAFEFKELIEKNMSLQYWDIEVWKRIPAPYHFSIVLKSKETDTRIWLDFYTMPAVAPFALPSSRFNFIYGLPFPPLSSFYVREWP